MWVDESVTRILGFPHWASNGLRVRDTTARSSQPPNHHSTNHHPTASRTSDRKANNPAEQSRPNPNYPDSRSWRQIFPNGARVLITLTRIWSRSRPPLHGTRWGDRKQLPTRVGGRSTSSTGKRTSFLLVRAFFSVLPRVRNAWRFVREWTLRWRCTLTLNTRGEGWQGRGGSVGPSAGGP